MTTEIVENSQSEPKAKKTTSSVNYVSLDYSTLRNLKARCQKTNPYQTKLLPGLGIKTKLSFRKKKAEEEPWLMQEPRLLSSAKKRIQQHHSEIQNDSQASNLLGLSSFLNSRQLTPINPLNANASRKKNNASQKNKLNSISSELFDIQSNPEEQQNTESKFNHPQFRIYDKVIGQSQVVYQYVFGKEKAVNPKIINSWKNCLLHEDKVQIYVPFNDSYKSEIPYSNSRIYALNEIEKGFKQIYGVGKNRSLKIGQQAIILDGITRYLGICRKDTLKISRKDFDIIENILTDCKMAELQNYPLCMKQIETHFKIMATKWKYSGILDIKDKIVESALIMGKNNFLDLNKSNLLTNFLLKNSNISQI